VTRRSLIALTASSLFGVALLLARDRGGDAPELSCEAGGRCASGAISEQPAAPPPALPSVQRDAPATEPSAAALRQEADQLIRDGKVLEGVEVFRRAVEAEPTAQNHGDLGSLLYRLTAFDEAAIHLRAAAELDPTNADRWIALANVYYRKVDPGEAWKAEKRAREAEPGLELARDGSGMRIRKGDKAPREP